jgi:hypothetical protein
VRSNPAPSARTASSPTTSIISPLSVTRLRLAYSAGYSPPLLPR